MTKHFKPEFRQKVAELVMEKDRLKKAPLS